MKNLLRRIKNNKCYSITNVNENENDYENNG